MWAALSFALAVLAGDPIGFQLKNDVAAGQKPTLTIQAVDRVQTLRVELSRDDGETFSLAHAALAPGERVVLPIGDGKAGQSHYQGKLSLIITRGGGPWSYELAFDTIVRAPLGVIYDFEHLDLAGHLLRFQLSRPAGRAKLEVVGEDGRTLGHGEATYAKEPAGTWLALPWTQQPGTAMALRLEATAADGLVTRVELWPWQVTIEHEDVNFKTDSAAIEAAEAGKLDASLRKIAEAARRAERFVKVRLYVAGHTDTVGSKEHNRKLSLDRARAIAEYFRRQARGHALTIPIAYEGFGEDVPKVLTPDETDELRNRRADYVLAAAAAPAPSSLAGKRAVRANWKSLP